MIDVPVQVKDILREGNRPKNYRFLVLNDDGTTDFIIDNNNLVSESVSIDERMCSGDTIKFGLCEGSSLEFQYFGLENITGRRLQAFIDVNYNDITKSIYSDVKKQYTNIRQSSGGYSWHSSDYTLPSDGVYKVYVSERLAYFGDVLVTVGGVQRAVSAETFSDGHKECYLGELETGAKVMIRSNSPACTAMLRIKTGETIPMGFFDVKNCSRQASTGIIKVTAYNKLQSDYLDAKANELINEIVQEGEPGKPSQTVSLRTMLDRLLGDYAIEVRPDIADQYQATKNNYFVDVYCYSRIGDIHYDPNPLLTHGYADGHYLKTQVIGLRLNIETGFNPDKYYRFEMDPKAFNDYCESLRHNYVWKNENEKYMFNPGNYSFGDLVRSFSDYYDVAIQQQDTLGMFEPMVVADWKYEFYPHRDVEHYNSEWYTGLGSDSHYNVVLLLPVIYEDVAQYNTTPNYNALDTISREIMPFIREHFRIYERDLSAIEYKVFTLADVESWSDVTLRQLQTAVFETQCQFGQLSRITDLFSGVELNRSRLYPADALYPSESLYPDGAQESGFRSQYSQLWADEGNIHKWRYLIITYKGLDGDGNEIDRTLQRTINNDGTDNYNMSDNWLFRNLVWTPEQVGAYADAMVLKMRDITWFPFEMWCAGLPYLETGDEIEIPLGEETYTSYILQRQLKGIQNLQDTYINGTLDIF